MEPNLARSFRRSFFHFVAGFGVAALLSSSFLSIPDYAPYIAIICISSAFLTAMLSAGGLTEEPGDQILKRRLWFSLGVLAFYILAYYLVTNLEWDPELGGRPND